MFGLQEMSNPQGSTPPFLNNNAVLLTNARSGILLLVELLSPSQVWMPSYLCETMIESVSKSPATVKFYEIDYNLTMQSLDWTDSILPNDLVVVIDYFGFPCDSSNMIQIKECGAWILEDACQALLTETVGQFSDFVIFSPRKFLGVPDGGILLCNHEITYDAYNLKSPPAEWWLKAFLASILRREFDLYGGDRRWFQLFQETEDDSPIRPCAMSELSRLLLQHSFDYMMIKEKRIRNYELLANKLDKLALFPSLLPGVVPLGFPIRIKNRDKVRQALFDFAIYPPVHWPIADIVPKKFKSSHRLAAEIMTLPCDQRYDSSDMEWIVRCISELLK